MDARELALRYLALMEARDIAGASRLVHPQAEFVFPGGAVRHSLAEIVAGSAQRYRCVAKTIERCDVGTSADGQVVVHVLGTLHGRWRDGSPFAGICFIDRFEIVAGLIERQEVWNDAGEARLRLGAAQQSAVPADVADV